MNALVAPKPAPAALARWTRPAEFLVYLVPVGTISAELYDGYVRLLQAHSVLAIRALTRPGGYAAELSPFRSFAWDGAGAIRFRFVSTTDKIDAFDGEDVHASARAVGVLGICHCPTTPSLPAAYQQFMDSIRHFPGLLIQKCFAFEHQFDLRTVEECAPLSHLVMFPVYHELDATTSGETVMSTVSLHLQVVLDTISVTILMSLESTVRAAVRQQQTQMPAPSAAIEMGDAAGFLLDTNVEPSTAVQQQQHHASALSPFPSSRETLSSGGSSPSANRSLPGTPTNDRASSGAAAGGGGGVSSLFVSAETRNRRRHLARQRKLFGDYAVLLSCIPDAIEHYVAAIELLRDEERKSGGAPGDTLWLAAALEGYVFCLYQQCQDKFVVEIVEKASEAVALYAKAGVSELEISLVEHIGWYYTAVAVQLSSLKGMEKIEEATWVKRLLWEVVERGVMVFPDVPVPRQVQFLIQSASMVEAVGHHRRMALYLHEAVALLAQRWRPSNGLVVTSPGSQSSHPHQRAQELRVALRLEMLTAQRLGMSDRTQWEVTSLRRRTRRLRRLQRQQQQKKTLKVTLPMAMQEVEPWLVLRFHVLRQLVTIAKMLADPFLVGRHCIQLLQVLSWCDELAYSSNSTNEANSATSFQIDQPQIPFSASAFQTTLSVGGYRGGLHTRVAAGGSSGANFSGVYATPPASIEVKSKRYFNMTNSPSATMSSAAATITSTIANTPRTLLAAPRQQFTAAVSAISTKANPAFSSFSHAHHSPASLSTPPATALNNRSSSANAAELLNGGAGGTPVATNGIRNNALESELAKPTNGSVQPEPVQSWSVTNEGTPMPVWDLRSRIEIQRLQRRVLSILEAECAVMRPTEQLKLDTFVQVDAIRVLHDEHRNPVLKKDVALAKCGVATSVSDGSSTAQAPPFFYNPFDKKKTSESKAAALKARCNSASDSEDEEPAALDSPSSEFERCFPLHERVQIEVTMSNPLGVELELQQVAVWVDSSNSAKLASRSASSGSAASAVEAYPSSVVLKPYERKKKIVLGVRGLGCGSFRVSGCFIKVLNIKTSYALKTPLPLEIIDPLPMVSLSVVEIGSLTDEAGGREMADEVRSESDASATVAITGPICMFANETKRCVLHVRNMGQRAVQTLHVAVRAGKAGISLGAAQSRTILTTLGNQSTESPLAFETEGLHFKCLASGESLTSLLPLEHGDHMAIPFEVSLRSLPKRATANRREQLQWTFVYADDRSTVDKSSSESVYYRESQQIVTLVPLGSLMIHRVQVLPKISFAVAPDSEMYDHVRCTLVVEITNPTETVFLVRLRNRAVCESDSDWDIEIGRQSSRSLVIEIPRLDAEQFAECSLADVLNGCLDLTWKTYFGTTGSLFFHDGLWTDSEREIAVLQLTQSDLSFSLRAGEGLTPSEDPEGSNSFACKLQQEHRPQFPFRFYQPGLQNTSGCAVQIFTAKLFQPCTVMIYVRQPLVTSMDSGALNSAQGTTFCSYVEAEVRVQRETDSASSFSKADEDAVMVAGQTKRILSTSDADGGGDDGSMIEWHWRVVCVFLSEGIFEVSVGGRSLGVDEHFEETELSHVWCHEPLRIRCIE